jgi:cytochrome c-type biogenesis protein CcmF
MEDIQYIGEHLLPGKIGQLAMFLSFAASILAILSYYFATQKRDTEEYESWRNLGRFAFVTHGIGIFAVIGVIFYVMVNQYYEYQYVQAHVSEDLPMKYIFSAFWEGQEGSFLLWMFWHIVLGFILIGTAKKWEGPVMATLASIQLFIGSMILGVYVGFGDEPARVGSNPLMLLRDMVDAPIFANADYVSLIKGTGLNPLLQNYWMTIHPPTLFLGFASTAIPFCFAIAGLWTKEHKAWLKPALPWALFSGFILGTGILMGGAWAYEALSFGGYWAWDPVENMSLVPWLILIAGIHTNLIAKNTNYSIRSTYIYYLMTFLFIVYSTFLTRSGVLGETSVHAFTEMGLETQLILFIVAYSLLSIVLLAVNYKQIPGPKKEEATPSREFWMFIGTLVLLFSGLIITASTSLPVYNKIVQFFDPVYEGSVITDPVPHYNKYQIWIAIFIAFLSGISQYLRYRGVNWTKQMPKFLTRMGISFAGAAILSFLTLLWIDAEAWQYKVLLFAGMFAVVSNLDYIIFFMKGNMKAGASGIAHLGFGIMVVGILASGLNKNFISSNPFIMDGLIEGASEESLRNNILLFKDSPMLMKEYEVTYTEDSLNTFTRTYTVNYKRKDESGKVIEEFNLYPNILYDKSFTKIAASNPSTKRYWNRDIFTHIASLPQVEMDAEYRQEREDSLKYKLITAELQETNVFLDTVPIKDQDTFVVKRYDIEVLSVSENARHPDYKPELGDVSIGAKLRVRRDDIDEVFEIEPILVLREQLLYSYPVQMNELSAKIRLSQAILDQVLTIEQDLNYQEFNFKQGDEIQLGDQKIRFVGVDKTPQHPSYEEKEGDIAISAIMEVEDVKGATYVAKPMYFIRDNKPYQLKYEVKEAGTHFRFVGVNPTEGTMQMLVAQTAPKVINNVPVELATNSLRSDYIVLEAIEFPGINLFWAGSVFMMIGLLLGMWNRMSQPKIVESV